VKPVGGVSTGGGLGSMEGLPGGVAMCSWLGAVPWRLCGRSFPLGGVLEGEARKRSGERPRAEGV
jgi:hypothetical protein